MKLFCTAVADALLWCVSIMLFNDFTVSVYADRSLYLLFAFLCAINLTFSIFTIHRARKRGEWKSFFRINAAAFLCISILIFLSYFDPFPHIRVFPTDAAAPAGAGLLLLFANAAFLILFLLSRGVGMIGSAIKRKN